MKSSQGWMANVKAWLQEEPGKKQPGDMPRASNAKNNAAAALLRWKQAAQYFEQVRDPLLVEYAAYEMEAAKKQYLYLLRLSEGEDAG